MSNTSNTDKSQQDMVDNQKTAGTEELSLNNTQASAAGSSGSSPGSLLADARRAKNMSVMDVADQLKLTRTVVVALENDDSSELPPAIFTRGYLRAYSKLMGIDESLVLEPYEASNGSKKALVSRAGNRQPISTRSASMVYDNSAARRGRGRFWIILLLLLVIGGLAAAWALTRGDGQFQSTLNSLTSYFSGDEQSGDGDAIVSDGESVEVDLNVDPVFGEVELPPEASLNVSPGDSPTDFSSDSMGSTQAGTGASSASNAVTGLDEPPPVGLSESSQLGVAAPPAANASSESQPATSAFAPEAEPELETETDSVVEDEYDFVVRVLDKKAWVSIRDRNGRRIIRRDIPANTTEGFTGDGPYRVILGNSDQVIIEINGVEYDFSDSVNRSSKIARFKLDVE